MEIESMMLYIEDNIKNANTVKDMVVDRLFRDGKIDAPTRDNYILNWNMITIKRSWWKSLFNIKKEKDGWEYRYIKTENV